MFYFISCLRPLYNADRRKEAAQAANQVCCSARKPHWRAQSGGLSCAASLFVVQSMGQNDQVPSPVGPYCVCLSGSTPRTVQKLAGKWLCILYSFSFLTWSAELICSGKNILCTAIRRADFLYFIFYRPFVLYNQQSSVIALRVWEWSGYTDDGFPYVPISHCPNVPKPAFNQLITCIPIR